MTEVTRQLYSIVRGVELPAFAGYDPLSKAYTVLSEKREAWVALSWPDGFPCIPAEMYMADRTAALTLRSGDGGSAKVLASGLSQLIRLSWRSGRQLFELEDSDIARFVDYLRKEAKVGDSRKTKRNRNTINYRVAQWLEFLIWLQDTIYLDRVIVGTRDQGPQITCVESSFFDRRGQQRGRLTWAWPLAGDIPDPKRPISSELRNRLWDAAAELASVDSYSDRYKARFSPAELLAELLYLRKRRELMLSLLEATGCRPGELARLLVSLNRNLTKEGKIVLVTLKRKVDPLRKVPLEGGICIKFDAFVMKYRQLLLERLASRGVKPAHDDAVFLCSKKGTPLSERTLTKEFQRLAATAHVDERACLSMFRHRFITMMVSIHLREFIERNPGKTRGLMTDADYLSILKRVATFTGHANPSSLMHYLDLAWEELGTFDYVQPAFDLVCGVDGAIRDLRTMADEISQDKTARSRVIIERVVVELDAIRRRTNASIRALGRPEPTIRTKATD
jgi:integrase